MLKHIIAIVVISLLVIIGMSYAQHLVQWLVDAHDWISNLLMQVFSVGEAGSIIRQLIALLAIPLVLGLIPAIIYWLAKRGWFPYFMEVVWVVWFIQTSALVVLFKATTTS